MYYYILICVCNPLFICFVPLQDGPREVVAIKCVDKTKLSGSAVDNIITEISLLKLLKHENIVEMKDFLWDDK